MRQLPHESIIYFGDTARVPYGPKSPDTVRRYSREIAGFLREQGVKSIVIACNTATAHALTVLREEMDMPVIGVVEPGARAAVAATRDGHIGVIGTAGTIRSGAYERAIRALESRRRDHRARLSALRSARRRRLDRSRGDAARRARNISRRCSRATIDTLVLGCTHYPLLKPLLARDRSGAMSASSTAPKRPPPRRRERSPSKRHRSAPTPTRRYRFIASDDPLQFLQLGQRFLGGCDRGR